MGQDSDGGDRDITDKTMAQDHGSDEEVTGIRDVSDISKMGSAINFTKMADFTKTGHMYVVR